MIELEYYRFAIPTQKSDLIKDDKLQQTDNGSPVCLLKEVCNTTYEEFLMENYT